MTEVQRRTAGIVLRGVVPLLILAAGIAAFVLLAKLLKSEPATAGESSDVVGVRTAVVAVCRDGMTIEADGIVVPFREVSLAAEVSGRVSRREDICRAGNFVKQGTLLYTIDPEDYELEEERLEKEHQQTKEALDELTEEAVGAENLIKISIEQLDLRKRETARWGELATNFQNVAETDQAKINELLALNALTTLQNRLRLLNVTRKRLESTRDLAEAKLKRAQLDLRRTQIYAPVDGVIVEDYIEQDSFVQRGTMLLKLEDTSQVEVKCKLEMQDLYWLWDRSAEPAAPSASQRQLAAYGIPETDVEVIYRLTGRNNLKFAWKGRLSRYDGMGLDEKTRTVPCSIVVENPRRRVVAGPATGNDESESGTSTFQEDSRSGPPALVRGMFVTIRFHVKPKTALLEVPEIAVKPGNTVWAVRNGKLAIEKVNFVSLSDQMPQRSPLDDEDREHRKALIYVDTPGHLAEGDEVVISPLSFVRTGLDVTVLRTEKK